MTEAHMDGHETSPRESLEDWAQTLSEAEIQEIDLTLKTYRYDGKVAPELLFLNQKGVEALKALTQLRKEPEQVIEGYYEIPSGERESTLISKRIELSQQLENSLALAKDKLYDYEDEEIAQFEQEAQTLFDRDVEYKQAA